jgi:hypothetical protein
MKTFEQVIGELRDFVNKGDVSQGYLLSHADAEVIIDFVDHMLALAGKVSARPSYADIAKDARHDLPVTDSSNA